MSIVTVDDLTLAIKNSIDDSHAMVEEQAYELAHHVLNFFGYSDRIIDNVLEPEDRDAFYMLEDGGILTTVRRKGVEDPLLAVQEGQDRGSDGQLQEEGEVHR